MNIVLNPIINFVLKDLEKLKKKQNVFVKIDMMEKNVKMLFQLKLKMITMKIFMLRKLLKKKQKELQKIISLFLNLNLMKYIK